MKSMILFGNLWTALFIFHTFDLSQALVISLIFANYLIVFDFHKVDLLEIAIEGKKQFRLASVAFLLLLILLTGLIIVGSKFTNDFLNSLDVVLSWRGTQGQRCSKNANDRSLRENSQWISRIAIFIRVVSLLLVRFLFRLLWLESRVQFMKF